MKRIAVIIVVMLTLALFTSFALAEDSRLYEDKELGFSFELPVGMEYQGDLLEETKALMQDRDIQEIDDAMNELGQSYEKQPFYAGYSATLNIVYTESTKLFDEIERALPDGVTRDEIDFCLLSQKEQQQALDGLADVYDMEGMPENDILSKDVKDFGGKYCTAITAKGYNSEVGVDFYQYSISFYYKNYSITITYTNFDLDGTLNDDNAFADFEESLSTLNFDTVPSDPEAKLKTGISIDWTSVALTGVAGGVIGVIIGLINRNKRKKRAITEE